MIDYVHDTNVSTACISMAKSSHAQSTEAVKSLAQGECSSLTWAPTLSCWSFWNIGIAKRCEAAAINSGAFSEDNIEATRIVTYEVLVYNPPTPL